MTTTDQALQAECNIDDAGAAIDLRYSVVNTSDATVHVFASERMPYLLRQPDGSIQVLLGVNPPNPDVDYPMHEVPATRPLAPGERLIGHVRLSPLVLADHFEKQRAPTPIHGVVKVVFSVGWGRTPIDDAQRKSMSMTQLLAWQHVDALTTLELTFPD